MFYELLLPYLFALNHGLERGSAATHFSLMRAVVVVVMQLFVEIGFKHIDAVIKFVAERDLIKLLQDRLVDLRANTLGLW